MSAAVTQAEFARLMGWGRSYITALKKDGRLVLDGEGKVLVEESRRRLAETADPNRDDVKARWRNERGEQPAIEADAADLTPTDEGDIDQLPESKSHDFHAARAKKEHYLAEQARIEYERETAKLVEKAEVEAAVMDLITTFRQALENLPHRTAPELVGKGLDTIRAILKQEIFGYLSEMEREFSRRIAQMGSEE